ncbi:MAG TPA: hypothetical protein PKL13_03905 [bacterium]|nr:hypothetical protein [bacterium]
MFHKVKIFFRKTWIMIPTIFSLLINISIWFIIYRIIDFTRSMHVLHYNFYFGIDYLNDTKYILFAPILGLLLILLNFILGYFYNLKKESVVLPYILSSSGTFLNILMLIYLLKIISIEY